MRAGQHIFPVLECMQSICQGPGHLWGVSSTVVLVYRSRVSSDCHSCSGVQVKSLLQLSLLFWCTGEEVRRFWRCHGQDHSARQAGGHSLLQDQGAALQGWVSGTLVPHAMVRGGKGGEGGDKYPTEKICSPRTILPLICGQRGCI